jgi:methyl-accepting chemotaxis protein
MYFGKFGTADIRSWSLLMRIRLGISAKFVGVVALSLIGIVAVTALTLSTLRENLLTDRKAKTREIVEVAWSLVDYYGQLVQSGSVTEMQGRQQAANALEKLRYSGDGYVWVNDMQPRLVMHPMRKDLMDKDLATFTDARGSHIYSDLVRIAQAGGGFDSFWFSKPGAPVTQAFPKIAYVKAYMPW